MFRIGWRARFGDSDDLRAAGLSALGLRVGTVARRGFWVSLPPSVASKDDG
jgi:hypothetical protein